MHNVNLIKINVEYIVLHLVLDHCIVFDCWIVESGVHVLVGLG